MEPTPPSNLSAELFGVWQGWSKIGNREVAREAASKGLHIFLAYNFLSGRKKIDINETKLWFNSEIKAWALQLLERKQVFKATHILSNIGLNPYLEFIEIIKETHDNELRDYLASHLFKTRKIDDDLHINWKLLTSLLSSDNKTISSWNDDYLAYNLITFCESNLEWKKEIATEIFFDKFDFIIVPFLEPSLMWKHLIQKNKILILHDWIHVYFSSTLFFDDFALDYNKIDKKKLHELFLNSKITPEMINSVKSIVTSDFTKQYIYTELSEYGIFNEIDINNVSSILLYVSRKENLQKMPTILCRDYSTLKYCDFTHMLIKYCIKNMYFDILVNNFHDFDFSDEIIVKYHSEHLELWLAIKAMFRDPDSSVSSCIMKAAQFFCDNDLDNYFLKNPIIFLSLILLNKKYNVLELLNTNESITIDNVVFQHDLIQNIFDRLPLVNNVLQKLNIGYYTQDISLYQLLQNYEDLDMTKVFNFRFTKNLDCSFPYFTSDYLVKKFGHREQIKYTHYLKQGRPSIASKIFFIDNFKKYGKITKRSKTNALNRVHSIAISNFNNNEITAACIAFLEIIGCDSDILRVHINAANFLDQKLEIEIVNELFRDLYPNRHSILNLIEKSLFNENEDLSELTPEMFAVKLHEWEFVVRFAQIHKLFYPELFLTQLAKYNDWLYFIIFIQYHKYPLSQILDLLEYFDNKNIQEHLKHALSRNIKTNEEKGNRFLKSRDSRRALYSRIGVKQSDSLSQSSKSTSSGESIEKTEADAVEVSVNEEDLFFELSSSHKSADPFISLLMAAKKYENPVFAVFATCYEPESVLLCWLTWLSAATKSKEWPLLNNRQINPEIVEKYMENTIKYGYIKTLAESFSIFLPENPLCSFTSFLRECSKNLHNNTYSKYLKLFKTVVNYLQFKPIEYEDNEMSYLTNRTWITKVALKLACFTIIYCFKSKYHQEKFIRILSEENLESNFNVACPDFTKVAELIKITTDTTINLNLEAILEIPNTVVSKKDELIYCINELIKLSEFDKALKICECESIQSDNVLIEKWKLNYQTKTDNFWTDCEKSLREYKVEPTTATKFYISLADNISKMSDKYFALKLAFGWLKECGIEQPDMQTIEIEMWWSYLSVDDWHDIEPEFTEEPFLRSVLSDIRRKSGITNITVFRKLDSPTKINRFEELIDKLIDKGQIIEAYRIEFMFSHKTKNLSLLETCMKLAEGELTPSQLSDSYKKLIEENKGLHKRRTLTWTIGSSTINTSQNVGYDFNLDSFEVLEILVHYVKHGTAIAWRILCCVWVSNSLNSSYARILATYDALSLLKIILQSDSNQKFELIHDTMKAHNWSKHEIADFLCGELVSAISKSVLNENLSSEPISLWNYSLDTIFHVVLELCPEPSLLGSSLLSHVAAPLSSDSKSALCLAGELIIRAHDCFTKDCNMEGISRVLSRAKTLVSNLSRLQAWGPIVRLLTGISRYSEMEYVFHILQENEQFEWLLGQRTARATDLRRATVEYLKNSSNQRELSRLVALRWGLHDTAADLWEIEAKEIISSLVKVARLEMQNSGKIPGPVGLLELNYNDPGTKKCLDSAMICLTHAAQHHMLANRYNCALSATNFAELIALQIGLLTLSAPDNAAVSILELKPDQVSYLVINKLEFIETRILNAYYKYPIDWGAVLYEQCVVKGHFEKYLPAFLSAMELTEVLAKDVVRRYLADQKYSKIKVPAGLKKILEVLSSPSTKYRLASELGLKNMVQELLDGNSNAYLKDTVWKTGCPPPNP